MIQNHLGHLFASHWISKNSNQCLQSLAIKMEKSIFFQEIKKNCKDEDPQNGPQISYPVSENCLSYNHPNQSKPTKVRFHLNLPFISFTPHFFCPFGTSLYNEFLRNQMQSKQMGPQSKDIQYHREFSSTSSRHVLPSSKRFTCAHLWSMNLFLYCYPWTIMHHDQSYYHWIFTYCSIESPNS